MRFDILFSSLLTSLPKRFDEHPLAKGTLTGEGVYQTVAHNLGVTPNCISIVPLAASTSVSSLYADETNFYVIVTNGKSCNWIAEIR